MQSFERKAKLVFKYVCTMYIQPPWLHFLRKFPDEYSLIFLISLVKTKRNQGVCTLEKGILKTQSLGKISDKNRLMSHMIGCLTVRTVQIHCRTSRSVACPTAVISDRPMPSLPRHICPSCLSVTSVRHVRPSCSSYTSVRHFHPSPTLVYALPANNCTYIWVLKCCLSDKRELLIFITNNRILE